MYLKYSTGFLIASLVQAGIVMITEKLGISSLGAKLTAMQLLTHILAGQVVGYILLFAMRKDFFNTTNFWLVGSIAGSIAWLVLLSINSSIGKVNAPWKEGISTLISSLLAFIVFGIISSYTIKTTDYNTIKE